MMPFGKWPDFQACQTEMMGPPNNYDEETAKKTCGKLQGRLEGKQVFKILKAVGNRRIVAQYVHVEGLDLEKDIIPNHRVKEALEELKQRDPRYQNVNWKHTGYQLGHPLWSYRDADGILHKTEVDEYGLWGITEIRNDGYKMADTIWNRIMAGIPMGASIGVDPHGQAVILTKDEIQKRGLRKDWEGGRYWDVPLSFIEPWSLTEHPANQYVTTVSVLSKEICEPCIETRAQWYLMQGLAKNIEEARSRARNFYINYSRLEKQKPPQDWWDACQANVTGGDKDKVCGHIFHNVLGGDRSKADPSMFTKTQWKTVFKAQTYEECLAEANANPEVDDPEQLCGHLKPSEAPQPKSVDFPDLTDETLFRKLWKES